MADSKRQPFASWQEVLAYCAKHGEAFYKAPLDYYGARVRCEVRGKKILCDPGRPKDCDPFVADSEHLDRFYTIGVLT